VGGFKFPRVPDESWCSLFSRALFFIFTTWNYSFAPALVNLFLVLYRRDLTREFAVELGVMNFLFVFRSGFTSLRYALMDTQNRMTIYYSKNRTDVTTAQRDTTLVTGYFSLPTELVQEMLERSADELAIDIDETRLAVTLDPNNFISGKETMRLNAILQPLLESESFEADKPTAAGAIAAGAEDPDALPRGSVPLRAIAMLLLQSVRGRVNLDYTSPWKSSLSIKLWFWAAALGCALPLVVRYCFYSAPEDIDWTYVFTLFTICVCTMAHLQVVASLVAVAIYGMYRQAILAKHMVMLICPSSAVMEPVTLDVFRVHWWGGQLQWKGKWIEERSAGTPIVDVGRCDNVNAWFKLRQLVLNFGLKFQIRTSLICGAALALAVGLFASEVWTLYRWRNIDEADADDHDIQQFIHMTAFSTVYTLSAFLSMIILIILGDIVNQSPVWCRGLLLNQSVELWHRWFADAEVTAGGEAAKTSRVGKYLEIHDHLFPIRLLGIRASRALILSLAFGFVSTLGFAVNVVTYEID
jgi:hypothetical protein